MFELIKSYKDSEFLWAYILVFVLAIVVAMCSHEYAHARVAYSCGDDTAKLAGRMTLNPVKHFNLLGILCFLFAGFGWATPVPINPLKFKEYRKGIFLTSIAGVVTNFIICFVACGFSVFVMSFSSSVANITGFYIIYFLALFFAYLSQINLSLCIFNLLPLYPLDGYNILRSVTKGTNKFVNFLGRYGHIILLVLVFSTLLEMGMSYAVGNILYPINMFWMKIIYGMV